VCYQGRMIGIECKAGKGRATALQLHHLSEIRRCGGKAMIVNEENIDTLKKELQQDE